MSRPRLLDLFCGAGGAGMGYYRAGFDVIGVDIEPQPHYPFEFVQADALEYLAVYGCGFDVIHASPPCQEYSVTRYLRDAVATAKGYDVRRRPMLLDQTREALISTGKTWVIENVVGSPMPAAIELCGTAFGLPLLRHRWFEASFLLFAAGHCNHPKGFYGVVGGKVRGYGDYSSGRTYRSATGEIRKREGYPGKKAGVIAMGIDWMTVAEMCEAIPPIYTEFVGRQVLSALAN